MIPSWLVPVPLLLPLFVVVGTAAFATARTGSTSRHRARRRAGIALLVLSGVFVLAMLWMMSMAWVTGTSHVATVVVYVGTWLALVSISLFVVASWLLSWRDRRQLAQANDRDTHAQAGNGT